MHMHVCKEIECIVCTHTHIYIYIHTHAHTFASPPPSLPELSGTSSISAPALAGQLQRSESHEKVLWVMLVTWKVSRGV